MKLNRIKLSNFAGFTDFDCEFDGNITRLVGVNGSGKTTVGLTAIWACIKGIAEKNKDGQLIGERYRFIGHNKKTADIMVELYDEKKNNAKVVITNKISKDGNKIEFKADDNYPLSIDWLNNLLSVAFLSAKNFCQHSSKEQALLLGINTSEYDDKLEKAKVEYTVINRSIIKLGSRDAVTKVEKMDLGDLYNKRAVIVQFNNEIAVNDAKRANLKESITNSDDKIKRYELEIKKLQESIEAEKANKIAKQAELSAIQEVSAKSTAEIDEQIKNIEETNKKADLYDSYIKWQTEQVALSKQLSKNKADQDLIIKNRLAYITGFQFGLDDISVNDYGELLYKDRPINEPYFSKGELEVIVAKLYASRNPELKVRFIDDFEVLDEDNQEKLVTDLLSLGFQIITAEVGKQVVKNNTILLKECEKVDNYENELI